MLLICLSLSDEIIATLNDGLIRPITPIRWSLSSSNFDESNFIIP